MLSIELAADAIEFQKILLSCLGQRYPFALRDPTSYTLSNEPLTCEFSLCRCTCRQ
jgi:hypothetical protein